MAAYGLDLAEMCWGERRVGMRRLRSYIARLDERSALWRDVEASLPSIDTGPPPPPPAPVMASPARMREFFGGAVRYKARR